MTDLDRVVKGFEADAADELVARTRALAQEGKARWAWDPIVDGVAGLTLTGEPNRAVVVIYADGDWEADDEWLEG